VSSSECERNVMVAFQALRNTLHYGLGCSVGAVNAHVYDLMKTACLLVIT